MPRNRLADRPRIQGLGHHVVGLVAVVMWSTCTRVVHISTWRRAQPSVGNFRTRRAVHRPRPVGRKVIHTVNALRSAQTPLMTPNPLPFPVFGGYRRKRSFAGESRRLLEVKRSPRHRQLMTPSPSEPEGVALPAPAFSGNRHQRSFAGESRRLLEVKRSRSHKATGRKDCIAKSTSVGKRRGLSGAISHLD